jgi:hypothetical protein
MKGRRVSEGGDMTGKSPTGEGALFLWEGELLEGRRLYVWFAYFSGVGSLVLGFLRIIAEGTRLLGVLGMGAKIPFGILELGSRIGCS